MLSTTTALVVPPLLLICCSLNVLLSHFQRLFFDSDILRIDNLLTFTKLTKLQLDNNLIEKIENIDHLIHLEWLDLSFNNIEKIEGLETLVNLTDLSLHHNQISVIEGLDTLTKLDVLSIGDNEIKTLVEAEVPQGQPAVEPVSIMYLRRFKSLRSVNLAGNPVCENPDYEAYVVAFLPVLAFVDWRRITDEMRQSAVLKYQTELEMLAEKEKDAEKLLEKEEAAAAIKKKYADACVPEMYLTQMFVQSDTGGSYVEKSEWFESILDPEMAKLLPIPGLEDALTSFRNLTIEKVVTIGENGLKHAEARRTERALFFEALDMYRSENRAAGSALVDAFLADLAREFSIQPPTDEAVVSQTIDRLEDRVDELSDALMELEMTLADQMLTTTRDFGIAYRDQMIPVVTEEVNLLMGEIREAEEAYFTDTQSIAVVFFEKFVKGECEEGVEVTDDLHHLLRDKGVLTNVIVGAHDGHLGYIDTKEDELIGGVKQEIDDLIENETKLESIRNRTRLSEIINFCERQKSDITLHFGSQEDDIF